MREHILIITSMSGDWRKLSVTLVLMLLGASLQAAELFVDEAQERGLEFVHFNGMTGNKLLPEMMGAGGAAFDYDNDGDLDLYLIQGHIAEPGKTLDDVQFKPDRALPLSDRLFRNRLVEDGTFKFEDVTQAAGLGPSSGYGMGAIVADVDGDGDLDLFRAGLGGNQLLRNEGDGRFADVTQASGLQVHPEARVGGHNFAVSASFVDIDGDGDQDLYVGNYVDYDYSNPRVCKDHVRGVDYCGPKSFQPQVDLLYRNDGQGRFEEIGASAGINQGFGPALGVIAADFNVDGHPDLYVANDGMANLLWINDGKGKFVDDALLAGVAVNMAGSPEASMGVDAADFDGDGDLDLFMTHLDRETNTLYVNDGNGWFNDQSAQFAIGAESFAYTGFGTLWFDYDNDGWLDLASANGAVKGVDALMQAGDPYPLHQRNQIWRNLGDGSYQDVSDAAGAAFALSDVSRGMVGADFDNDGDTDLVITNNAGPVRLLMNQVGQDQAWVGMRLLDKDESVALHGARVAVSLDDATRWRWARRDGSYASSRDARVLIGLGGQQSATINATVIWPDNQQEQFRDLSIGRYHDLLRGSGAPPGE